MLAGPALSVALAASAPSFAGCPTQNVRPLTAASPRLPADAHPTRDSLRLLFDIGSDGRVRRVAVAESSGDPEVDVAAAEALAHFTYSPPSYRCVSVSTGATQVWHIPARPPAVEDGDLAAPSAAPSRVPFVPGTAPSPAAAAATPSPAPSAVPAAAPSPTPAPSPACVAPFVRVTRLVPPRMREPSGTADVDVRLDAQARVTHVQLARSSGNRRTDYAAAIIARTSSYAFLTQPGCRAGPTTYRFELSFR